MRLGVGLDIASRGGNGFPGMWMNFNAVMTSLPAWMTAAGFTYTRNSTKNVLQDGVLVQLANNQFGTSYDPVTGLYGYLPEPAATNLFQNSGLTGGGAVPTNWIQPAATGTSAPATSTYNQYATAYSQSATAERPFLRQDFSASANTTYTLSVFIESISGSVIAQNIISSASTASPTLVFPVCDANPAGGPTGIVTSGKLVLNIVMGGSSGVLQNRIGLGAGSAATGSVRFSSPQLETGSRASSWILTPTGATADRAADVLTCPLSNITGFNSAAYTMLVDARTDMSDSLLRYSLAISDTTANNYSAITRTAAGLIGTDVTSGGSPQVAIAETSPGTARAKSAFSCQANNFLRAVNGTSGTSDASGSMPVSPTTLYIGCLNGASQRNSYIYRCAIIHRALTQAQLNAITA